MGSADKTGYKWLGRYGANPVGGLADRPRAPCRPAHGLPDEMAEAIVGLRLRHPHWGPKKLRAKLRSERPAMAWPAASTIGDLLRREGLSRPCRRRRRAEPVSRPFLAATAPNEVWCADFKGWFRTADGQRCDPLTISDAHSRFLLDCRITAPTGDGVRPVFDRAFANSACRGRCAPTTARRSLPPRRRPVPACRSLGQARHPSRTYRARSAAAERPA